MDIRKGTTQREACAGETGGGTRRQRRRRALWCMLLGCMLLAGCGARADREAVSDQALQAEGAGDGETGTEEKREEGQKTTENGASGESGFFEIQSETEELFEADEMTDLICMQFYQGEPVQLRCRYDRDQEQRLVADVYLYREDGSSELLLEGVEDPNRINRGTGLLAQDGSFYYVKSRKLVKWDSEGRMVYEKEQDLRFKDICQLTDGTIVVLAENTSGLVRTVLMKLDADTGATSGIDNVMLSNAGLTGTYKGIAAGSEGLLLLERTGGIYEIDLTSGSKTNILSFQNATVGVAAQYNDADRTLHDFRMLENGEAQLLWAQKGAGVCETLRLGETDKTVLVIRGYSIQDQWIREQIAEFNRTSQVYQVIMDTAEEGVEWEDYARQTSVELAAGKGPDLLYADVLGDYWRGSLLQGGFADLRPYMERGGLEEENYFPIAFCSYGMGEGIYGISVSIEAEVWMIKGEILGGQEIPDIRTLVDALLAWPEEGCFQSCSEKEILRLFLEGSESLWGMIDWERGTCDFSGDLFADMLEAAKRYASVEGRDRPAVAWGTPLSSFTYFCGSEAHKKMGNVMIGTLFDDGCYAKKRFKENSLSVNANSPHQQGAWEFISFLLGDKAQLALAYKEDTPVSRTAFCRALDLWLENLAKQETKSIGTATFYNGQLFYNDDWVTYKAEDVTEEWTERYRQTMEEVRLLPLETEPVLEIIDQETDDYFKGIKNAEEVAEIVRNRVQLYLDENL